ncbi:MAG: fumarylacetoacetate hydrolase family protein [Flavobacteriaceae bacterium]|jgi:2-keto-4-pentenoate hydratase/2-oxohepta-3-ene-1,7-dioic acid hydratase in catechol pathway|nr:fumarylacetoacetate hydrolase family protein [Flavobacteriaceae bacterium]
MKIICVGRNYVDHIAELNNERPTSPVLFIKPDTALIGKEMPFIIPEFSKNVHYELELVVKINKVGKFIESKFAHKYYDEIALGIDFTARDVQDELKSQGLPWEKAKGFDSSAFVSAFVNKNSLENLNDIQFALQQNQTVVQDATSALMIWNIDELIAEVSKYFTLKKGDLIFTGTPAGVGKVDEGDVLEGYLANEKLFRLTVK